MCECARAVAFVFLPLTLEMFTPPFVSILMRIFPFLLMDVT